MLAAPTQTLAFYNFRDDILPVLVVIGAICLLWVLWTESLRLRSRGK